MDTELLKTIGAGIGIAISAVASTTTAVIALLRLRFNQRHIVVRLKVWRPLDDPRDVQVTASVFNQGRPVFVEDLYVHIGKDWQPISHSPPFPQEVATGHSLSQSFILSDLEADMENLGWQFNDPITYKDGDLPKMRLQVTDGEGHEHWASLRGESVRNIEAVVRARHDHPYETVGLKPPSKVKM